jgi:hypothetical protein
MQIDDADWSLLLPKLSKKDIETLQSEEQWNELPKDKLAELQNIGYGSNGKQEEE